MFCRNCGTQWPEETVFCGKCGTALKVAEPAPQPVEEAPAPLVEPVPQPIPEGTDNHVGLACYAAICSKILNRNLAIKDICFVGGCDLNGSLYFDENNLTPLLRAMKNRGVSTLYAPMGTNRLVDAKVNSDCQVTVIEGIDATTLFSLAVTRNNSRC